MKSLMVKVVLPIILIFLFTYASAQQNQTEPRDAEFYYNRGFASHWTGQYDQAIPDYNKALEINPMLAEAYNNRGLAYANKGQLDQAISDYNKALEINPSLAKAYKNRGIAYEKKGQYDQATSDYTKDLEINPRDAKAYYNRGLASFRKGEYDQTISDCTEALEIEPRYAEAYILRGVAYSRKGQYDQAISDYTKALEINPRDAKAYYSRGLASYRKGQYDQTISDCTNALEIEPRYADAYIVRGGAYDKKGQYDQAISDYTKALEINPRHAIAYNNRGVAYDRKGQYDQAIDDFNKALEINPIFAGARNNRQISYEKKGQHNRPISDDTEAHGCGYSKARSNIHNNIIFFIVPVLVLLISFLLWKKSKSRKQTEYLQKHFPVEESYKGKTSNRRRKLLELISAFSGIGGGVGGIFLFIKFIDIYYPELNIPHKASIIEFVIAFSLIMGVLCIGFLIGCAVSLFVLRPFFTKEELSESDRDVSVLIDALWHPRAALRMVIKFIFWVSLIALPSVISIAFVKIVFHAHSIPLFIRIIIALIGSLLLVFVTGLAKRLLMKLKKPLQLVLKPWIYGLIKFFFYTRPTTRATGPRNKTRVD